MEKGIVCSVSVSPERGQLKNEVSEINVIKDFGIENDGHSGDWGRQVTCLNWDSIQKVKKDYGLNIGPGDFAENIVISGLDFLLLTVGKKFRLGENVVLEVSQIGKEDHPSIVTKTFGVSLLPSEGLFCKAVSGGVVKKGDLVKIL